MAPLFKGYPHLRDNTVWLVCSGIAKNAKNACAKSLGMVHDVYNEGEPSVGLFA